MAPPLVPSLRCNSAISHRSSERYEGYDTPGYAHVIRNNLPSLHSVDAIKNLNGNDLIKHLTDYGVVPPDGVNPDATIRLRKETLKSVVDALA